MVNIVDETSLLRLALIIFLVITTIISGLAPPAQARNQSSGNVAPIEMAAEPRAGQTARNRSLDNQQLPAGTLIVSQSHNARVWRPSRTYTYAIGPYTRVVSGLGWNADNQPWKQGTIYSYFDYVTSESALRAYALEDNNCTSTVAQTGTGTNSKVVTSDGCHWQYRADVLCTSAKSYIPTATLTSKNGNMTIMMLANHETGSGNDREYMAGKNGEASPIRVQDHNDWRRDSRGLLLGDCKPSPCHLIITAAPGENFHDSPASSDSLSGYDPSRGGCQDEGASQASVTAGTLSIVASPLIVWHGTLGIVFKYPSHALPSTARVTATATIQ